MVKISIEIPDELDKEIREFNLDVSGIIAKSIKEELIKLMALKVIASKSKMTIEEAILLGRKMKSGRIEELKKKGLV